MFYLDTQRTITRRDSSLCRLCTADSEFEVLSTNYNVSQRTTVCSSMPSKHTFQTLADKQVGQVQPLMEKHLVHENVRPWGAIRQECISSIFESMLEHIIVSWDTIGVPKTAEFELTSASDNERVASKKKRKDKDSSSRLRGGLKSRSRMDIMDKIRTNMSFAYESGEHLFRSWRITTDEKAVIRFKNGNTYEGNLTNKLMNGEGRYVWSDGTVYFGNFENNEIRKQGRIQWKDDSWYSGEFCKNMRHGNGLYVNSRTGLYYAGTWHFGTKHGRGDLMFSANNNYKGEWDHNTRQGYGDREYGRHSGYYGTWHMNLREGKGLMVFPNHDCYKGEWVSGRIHGHGIYIWDFFLNNTMTPLSLNLYEGQWHKGQRHGRGLLKLGLNFGLLYEGRFTENLKFGDGTILTANGYVIKNDILFRSYDKIGLYPMGNREQDIFFRGLLRDITIDYMYHVKTAIDKAIRTMEELNSDTEIINEYFENNIPEKAITITPDPRIEELRNPDILEMHEQFELRGIRRAFVQYGQLLRDIYHKYATLYDQDIPVNYKPILIRYYLWRFYHDIGIDQKGLTFSQIDNIFYNNKDWCYRTAHDPFEKIYYWQFVHCLISLAMILYADPPTIPAHHPYTLVGDTFRKFLECDVIPSSYYNSFLEFGPEDYAKYVPLKRLHQVYKSIGEPHTVRDFIQAVLIKPCELDMCQPEIIEPDDEYLPLGKNMYLMNNNNMKFRTDNTPPPRWYERPSDLPLFNIGNLTCASMIEVLAKHVRGIMLDDFIINLDIEMTFYEFFEVLIECCELSTQVREEEILLKELLELSMARDRHKSRVSRFEMSIQ